MRLHGDRGRDGVLLNLHPGERAAGPAHRATAAGLFLLVAGFAATVPALLRLDLGLIVRRVIEGDRLLSTSAPSGTAVAVALAAAAGAGVCVRLSSRGVALVGGGAAGLALGLTAVVDDPNGVLIALSLTAGLAAGGLTHHRALLIEDVGLAPPVRLLAWWWAAAGAGALVVLTARIMAEPDLADELRIASLLAVLGALILAADRSHPPPSEPIAEATLRFRETQPGARRTVGLWGGIGFLIAGAAPAVRLFLDDRWDLDTGGRAGVIGAAVLTGVLTLLFAHWWWDVAAIDHLRRPRVAGTAALAAAALVTIGAWSYTYPGLIAAWALGGAALAVTATAFDALTLVPAEPPRRRRLAAMQIGAFAMAGLVGAALVPAVGDSGRVRILVAAVPLAIAGWCLQRGAIQPATTTASTAERPLPTAVSVQPDSPLLSCESLDVSYGSVQVLFDLSLTVEEGELVALLGTNGAGKTTLLRTIAGLLKPDRGAVRLAGADITTFPADWRPGIGLLHVAGGESLSGPLTVDEHLRLFALDLEDDEREARLERAVDVFPRFGERGDQTAATLSGGEKQMLALAKAFITRPDVLLIDEFSLGLAPIIVSELIPVVAELNREGTAILLVEQSVTTALELADRVLCLERGGIVFSGAADELRDRPDLLEAVYLDGVARALADEDLAP